MTELYSPPFSLAVLVLSDGGSICKKEEKRGRCEKANWNDLEIGRPTFCSLLYRIDSPAFPITLIGWGGGKCRTFSPPFITLPVTQS
jgi:hypothetical protein